jgi:hypothetical protein
MRCGQEIPPSFIEQEDNMFTKTITVPYPEPDESSSHSPHLLFAHQV